MKKNNIKIRILTILLAVLYIGMSGIVIVSCNDDDDEMSTGVSLLSYGPMPIARGAELRFIGENFMQVSAVILPDGIEIPASEFTEHTENSIKLVVPQNAEPGLVVLKTSEGDITTKTQITYSEPISIDNFSPASIKPGQELTITGDYLNLIKEVIFTERVSVADSMFTSQSRKELKLMVPAEAQTGKIAVSNGAEDPITIQSETDLTVVIPTVSTIGPNPVLSGTTLTITGTDLDLVTGLTFGGNKRVSEFALEDETTITVTVPMDAQDGVVDLSLASGLKVSTDELVMVVPTVNVTPTETKNGEVLTVTGENLNLVSSISFAGNVTAYPDAGGSDTEFTVVVPNAALSGEVVFNTVNNKSVSGGEITLVKPTVTELMPNPVSAGNDLTINGTDLDLVVSVAFAGGSSVEVSPESSTSIVLSVPLDAETGELTLNLVNGDAITSTSLTVDKPEFCYIPVLPGDDQEINAGNVLSIDVENGDVLSDVQVNGQSTQYILEGSLLYLLVPNNAGGATELKLVSSNGEVAYTIDVIGSGTVETVVFEGPKAIGWGDAAIVPSSAFQDVPVGSILKIYFSQTENWGQAQINNGNWAVIPFDELGGDGYITTNTYNDKSVSEQELVLTQEVMSNILNNSPWGDGLIIQGQDWIINKISIITKAASETVIMDESRDLGAWAGEGAGGAFRLYKESFAGVSAGSILKFYISIYGWGMIQINDANWAEQAMFQNGDTSLEYYEFEMSQDFLDHIMNTNDGWSETAIVIQGQEVVISKVSIVPK